MSNMICLFVRCLLPCLQSFLIEVAQVEVEQYRWQQEEWQKIWDLGTIRTLSNDKYGRYADETEGEDNYNWKRDDCDQERWIIVETFLFVANLAISESFKSKLVERSKTVIEVMLAMMELPFLLVKSAAMRALGAICCNSEVLSEKVCRDNEGIKRMVVTCLEEEEVNEDVVFYMSRGLLNICDSSHVAKKMLSSEEANLDMLTRVVMKRANMSAMGNFCYLFANLVEFDDVTLKRVSDSEPSISLLIQSLQQDGNQFAVSHSARALAAIVENDPRRADVMLQDLQLVEKIVSHLDVVNDKSVAHVCKLIKSFCSPKKQSNLSVRHILRRKHLFGQKLDCVNKVVNVAIKSSSNVRLNALNAMLAIMSHHKDNLQTFIW